MLCTGTAMSSSSRMTSISIFSVVCTFFGLVVNMLPKKPGVPTSSLKRSSIAVVLISDMDSPFLDKWAHLRVADQARLRARVARLTVLVFGYAETGTRSGIEHCQLLSGDGR